MYSERELSIARALNNEETLAFLYKLFVDGEDISETEAKKNVVALSNERYGELMKVFYTTKVRFNNRINELKRIAKTTDGAKIAIAPK